MQQATKITIVFAITLLIILMGAFLVRREGLMPYRGMPSGRFSYSAVDWEDPEWSNTFALRGISGAIPDECHADAVGPDIVRLKEGVEISHPEDIEFAKQNGVKLRAPMGSSKIFDSRSESSAKEDFICSAMAAERSAAMLAVRQIPAPFTHAANPLLTINKALQQKTWDPVIVSENGYSTKV